MSLQTDIEAHGFTEQGTGGNCRALVKDIAKGYSVYITNDDSDIPHDAAHIYLAVFNSRDDYLGSTPVEANDMPWADEIADMISTYGGHDV